ncbi:mitochondrial ribosomal protein subunit L20-domain-containing protein [Pyrenochaeta sp. MPI-SDFR-AT-0127]|nr:mitochondrial ribosomal protein subunit L20-domain-containing protein [Pyrenochaeta sp. MPI-SDFR-AT-0127]
MSACRSLLRICPRQRKPSLLSFMQCRNESTTRRHKKLLALPEAPSYTSDRAAPTLVFNPPSSAPNVYHTPLKFLPKEDKRRQLYAVAQTYAITTAHRHQTSSIASPGTPLSTASFLPPRPSNALPSAVRTPYEKKYHVSKSEVEEIRQLRSNDPDQWTRVRLAEKFGCSQFFIGMVAKAPEKAERVSREHDIARKRWGQRRKIAREDRERRKVLWGQDA